MAQWMSTLSQQGRSEYLFELEMWLKSFERYFRISNQPLSQDSARLLAIRSFYEEVGLVANAIKRVNQLCMFLASEDQVNQERFDKYVENFLRQGDIVDPYVARLLHQKSPRAGLTLLRESFEDLHLILLDLIKLSRIPYATFQSVGRLIYREIRRNDYLRLLMDKKFKPAYDRMSSEPIADLVRRIEEKGTRRLAAKVFLEFFRLLHYLEFANPRKCKPDELRTTVLIFSLVASETRSLLEYLQRSVDVLAPTPRLQDTVERFIYCIPLELRKVVDTELIDISSFKQADSIYTSIENSHGILRDCFQQSVIQLAQVFNPSAEGKRVFIQYATKYEQSLALRNDLAELIRVTRRFEKTVDEINAQHLKEMVSTFQDRSLRYLMYRDWKSFELFMAELVKCSSLTGLAQIAHRFVTYLETLFREISKRNVLQGAGYDFPEELG
jgi:hypothetical protein